MVRLKGNFRDDPGQLGRAVFGVCLVLVLALTALILAQDPNQSLVRSVAVLHDPTGSLDIQHASTMEFADSGPSVPVGFANSVRWLRLSVAPDPSGSDIIIRLRPIVIDHATLYFPDGKGGWSSTEAGELLDAEAQSWPSLYRQSLLLPATGKPATVYLKIVTRSTSTIFVTAFSHLLAIPSDVRTLMLHVMVLGLKLASVLLILLTLPKRRNIVNIAYLALEGGLFLHLLVYLGYARAIFHDLPASLLDAASGISMPAVIAVGAFFHYALLGQFEPAGWSRKLARIPVFLGLLGLVLVIVGLRQIGLLAGAASYLTTLPAIALMLLTIRSDAPPGRRMLTAVYALYLPVSVLNFLTTVGLARIDWFYRNAVELSSLAISTLFLMLILSMNQGVNAAIDRDRQRLRQSVILNRAENQRRFGQHLLTNIVAAETRAGLAELQAILATQDKGLRSDELARALSGLEDIIVDCLQADEAETGQWKTQASAFDPVDAIRQLVAQHNDSGRVKVTAAEPLTLVSDAGLFSVLIRHLLVNALGYAIEGSVISVDIARKVLGDTPAVCITVSNRVPPGYPFDPVRCFEKFYRGPASSTTSGTGLGLYISREIVRTLGGEITATIDNDTVAFGVGLADRI